MITQMTRAAMAALLLTVLPGGAYAQTDHLVSPAELHQRAVERSQQRQRDLEAVQDLFSTETAQKALRSAKVNGEQVLNAVRSLDDEDLARLAKKARKAESDFAAGSLNNQQLTYIVIALATAVLVLLIVAA